MARRTSTREMPAAVAAALLKYAHLREDEDLFLSLSGGVPYFSLPNDEANRIANAATDLEEARDKLELMPKGPARGKVRLFHSVLKHPAYPDIFAAISDMLTGGLSVARARKYMSWAGPFRAIWTQTDAPYNKNVVWVAFDIDEKWFDRITLADIRDTRRRSPLLVHLNMDVPGKKIVAVSGLPVGIVRKALRFEEEHR